MALTRACFYSIVQFYRFQDFTVLPFIVTRTVTSMYICLRSLMFLIVSFLRSMTGKYCHTAIMIGMFATFLYMYTPMENYITMLWAHQVCLTCILSTVYVQTCRSDWTVSRLSFPAALVDTEWTTSPILDIASETALYTCEKVQLHVAIALLITKTSTNYIITVNTGV